MIGLVIVTHGQLAQELLAAIRQVAGPQQQAIAICIGPDDDMESRRMDIVTAVDDVDIGAGVVLLTDLFGGTPSNLAHSVLARPNTDVIAGVNLPMLVKFVSVRGSKSLRNAIICIEKAGRHQIRVASDVLLGKSDR